MKRPERAQNIIDVGTCLGTDALLGKLMGDKHFPTLLGAILKHDPDSIVYLDFERITNITPSYLVATLVRLLRMTAAGSLDRYLILRSIHHDYRDEVAYVLNHEHTPVLYQNTQGALEVLGPLDQVYAQTLDAVNTQGRVTARSLQAASTEKIGQTGWIKRLTTLCSLGLIKRVKTGREYTYEPLTQERNDHGRRFHPKN